jgi:hypothetical protein
MVPHGVSAEYSNREAEYQSLSTQTQSWSCDVGMVQVRRRVSTIRIRRNNLLITCTESYWVAAGFGSEGDMYKLMRRRLQGNITHVKTQTSDDAPKIRYSIFLFRHAVTNETRCKQ